jgi:hypothetical protein
MFIMIFKCFLGVFASVLDTCFKYFICFLLYVATVASECFKSRSGVAHEIRPVVRTTSGTAWDYY